MARRPTHAPGELREKILTHATDLIVERGLNGLSAREIAKRISYSPGTIYNAFENLDDVILTIESRLLDRLAAELDSVKGAGASTSHILELALVYLRFTQDNKNLWSLLFEHHLPDGRQAPDWYQDKINALMGQIEKALSPLMPVGSTQEQLQRSARVLWAGVHGITTLAATDKLQNVTSDVAETLIRDLVGTYVNGLASNDNQAGELRRCG